MVSCPGTVDAVLVATYNAGMAPKRKKMDTADQLTFETPDQLLLDSLILTHDAVLGAFQEMLRGYDVSFTQYCVLSILAQAGEDGLRTQKLGERLLTRVPDITRLVDRLIKAGLVERDRSDQDKRVVFVSITESGLELLHEIQDPATELRAELFTNLTENEQIKMNDLLQKLRSGVG